MSSETGNLVRQLTFPQGSFRDASPQVVRGAGATRVWYVHAREGTCGATQIGSVPITGGPARVELTTDKHVRISALAASGSSSAFAYAAEPCPRESRGPRFIAVGAGSQRAKRIDLPSRMFVFDLALSPHRLAFVVSDAHNHQALYSVGLRKLAKGHNPLGVATQAPPQSDCEWDHVTWSTEDLLATRTCESLEPRGRPTTVFALDPTTLQPVRRGPAVAYDLGVNGIDSDEAGHLLVWLGGGDSVGPVVEWTSRGRHRLPTPRCYSIDPQPDPCLRDPAW